GIALSPARGPVGLRFWVRWSAAARARKAGAEPVALARARSGANRGILPLVVMGVLSTGLLGFREYQAHLPALIVPADFQDAVVPLGQLTGHDVSKLEGREDDYVVRVPARGASRYVSA